MDEVVFVPRWGGTASSDWLPWLRAGLSVPSRVVELAPTPGAPTPEACVAALAAAGVGDPARTVVVGHSVGCQAVLRWLATLPDGVAVRGTVLVAPWRVVDDPWPSLMPWMDEPFDAARARAAAGRVLALVSDDDPFTADHAATRRWLEESFGATTRLVPGGKHFNRAQEPEVARALEASSR